MKYRDKTLGYKRYLGSKLCECLSATLDLCKPYQRDWYQLPDGTKVMIHAEFIYVLTNKRHKLCSVDLGDSRLTL